MSKAVFLFVVVVAVVCGTSFAGVYDNQQTWVNANLTLAFPTKPVISGFDPSGYYTYVGRLKFSNAILPARVVPELGTAYFNTATQSSTALNYQLLVARDNTTYSWVRSFDGFRELGAISVGTSAAEEPVYVCRSKSDGGLLTGTLLLSEKVCIIKSGEFPLRRLDKYEVLVATIKESISGNKTITP